MAKTSCKKGQYYCNTDQKCKPIPDGYKVREDGILVSEGSLRDWFGKSKSKGGKPGWVNVTTGGTCASDEPGEGVPKCVSRSKYESMTPAERRSASRRKKEKDKGQQLKRNAAKPTYVKTDKEMTYKKKKKTKKESTEFTSLPLVLEVPQNDAEFRLGLMFRESLEQDRGMLFIFESNDYWTFHMKNTLIPLDIAFIKEDGTIESIKELDPMNPIEVGPDSDIRYAIEVNRGWFAENGVVVGDRILEEEEELIEGKDKKGKGSGTKDACYHKVKSRYSVWPSAYASGALVKCRKVGAANWGNKSESVELGEGQKCWKGYEKKGTKKMFGKTYNNCVKKEHYDWRQDLEEKKKYNSSAENPAAIDRASDKLQGLIPIRKIKKKVKKIDEKLVHGNYGNFIKGQKLIKTKEKKYKEPPYKDLAASVDLEGDVVSEKKMTKKQIKKRDEIADAISTKDMKDRYGDKNVKYAIATKLAMNEDVLDERLRPLIKGASYLMRKAMKTRAKTPMGGVLAALRPTPKKSQLSQFAMYHGTSSKSAGKIMKSGKFKKSIGDVMNPDGSMYTGKRAFATTDPKRAKEYADMTAKYRGGKPEVLAVKVRDSNIMNPSGIPDEYYVKTKHMKPVGRGVKPIKIKKGEVMQNSFNPLEENTAIESELVIQDWNVDEIKYTEVEAVDIIKPEPLKPSSSNWRDDFEFVKEGAAWTKKSGKSESGGLNEKGRKSYERENPGSDLKRPSKKVGNKRRASFCARMKGMKKKLTSKKTANDPDSRINKSLRAWNC